jgi:hypothetical protein
MNLLNSILTSFVIVFAFWACALFQSDIAHAISHNNVLPPYINEDKQNTELPISSNNTQLKNDIIHISGLKKHIRLVDIKLLWQQFNNNKTLHKHLKQQPMKVYVLYSSLSKNYQKADVLIGYDINELDQFDEHVSVNTHQNFALLPKAKYTEQQLAGAWNKINYSTPIEYILEVHTLNQAGETTSAQMFISYK